MLSLRDRFLVWLFFVLCVLLAVTAFKMAFEMPDMITLFLGVVFVLLALYCLGVALGRARRPDA